MKLCTLILLTTFAGGVGGFIPNEFSILRGKVTFLALSDTRGRDTRSLTSGSSDVSKRITANDKFEDDEKFAFPWTEFQEWALRDNILKYVISVPRLGADEPELYALWRTMSREVIELSGYPVEMLREKYRRQRRDSVEGQKLADIPGILPMLDAYEFQKSGGLSGRAYGIPGVAEGSKIETTSVSQVQLTLPKGYVLTDDSSVVYELGTPLRDSFSLSETSYSLDGLNRSTLSVANRMHEAPGENSKASLAFSESITGDEMLIRLGASTATLLIGATAFNMLSHHLTVNIFWV